MVEAVQAQAGADQVAIVGWATGGHWAGMYASANPSEVSHLVFYNSLYGAYAGHPALWPGSDIADGPDPVRRRALRRLPAERSRLAAAVVGPLDPDGD